MKTSEAHTLCAHTEVHRLHDIHKCLVLLVFDVSSSPARRPGCLHSNLGRFLLQHHEFEDKGIHVMRWDVPVLCWQIQYSLW